MALYGAPIWAEALTTRLRPLLRRPQKLMAVRAIRAYRTVSGAAACALAGSAPWELEASVLEQTYRCRAEARARGERPTLEELVGVRRAAKTAVQAGWEEALRSARYGERTVQALLPVLADWRKRRHGSLTYRLVQLGASDGSACRQYRRLGGWEEALRSGRYEERTVQALLPVLADWRKRRHGSLPSCSAGERDANALHACCMRGAVKYMLNYVAHDRRVNGTRTDSPT
ncbi:uncharacterized protein LOC113235404 [Hyposmocoma kahamanoa]|uniref:uncharacterized protein LOC113235404 n=1 Tax=Hyposmocoma kahamanoa TaxID=1477025 RepID=UPI000E6D64BB|nr:uncharacterized protein LOC113235404 [Hyposmocoma kahamanoa]